jgi:HAE1 family hydrophobic/amphiphilic exporter-1
VDHVNGVRAREPALPLSEAILKGTLERVRPILMTTVTTVFGLLPLVLFGDGAGSNIWDALALVLIGGLLSSTLFVLTLTPALYQLLEGGLARRPAVRTEAVGEAVPVG